MKMCCPVLKTRTVRVAAAGCSPLESERAPAFRNSHRDSALRLNRVAEEFAKNEAENSRMFTSVHLLPHKKGKNYFWNRPISSCENPGALILRSIFLAHLNFTKAEGSEARCFMKLDSNHLRFHPKGRSRDLVFSGHVLNPPRSSSSQGLECRFQTASGVSEPKPRKRGTSNGGEVKMRSHPNCLIEYLTCADALPRLRPLSLCTY